MTPYTIEDQLIRDEKLMLKPYRDSVGKLTIGIGRNLDDVGITQDEATYLLSNDLARVRARLYSLLPWLAALSPARRGVFENMAFNMGVDGLMEFKQTLRLAQEGNYDDASQEMLKSTWATQVGDRSQRLSLQLKTGAWV